MTASRLALLMLLPLAMAGAAAAQEKAPPASLVCPDEVADADRVAMAAVGLEPGITGYCTYGLPDEDDDEATVTVTIKAATADYDWQTSFKALNVERGGMSVVEETDEAAPFGGRMLTAKVVTLANDEANLGAVTRSYRTLWLFDLGGGRKVAVEEEYTNLGIDRRAALREALLKAQNG